MKADAGIAVVALACRFPEAESPEALFDNVMAGRRAFRAIPPERLAIRDYAAGRIEPSLVIPDVPAALLTDWTFARDRFTTPRSAFEAADLTHWLALEVAADALERIGGADRLPRERTAVILGNTLTGEFSRAAQLRLRTPYLAERLAQALGTHGIDAALAEEVVRSFARELAADVPEPNEETLAGGLANTIAGRIANHFDFRGGAWTVDGACASSLLALADGCAKLAEGSADVVVAGGVDLSLDPFELVGFARAGALAAGEMRVFDRRAGGFWPGEGCGVAILASRRVAAALDLEPLAWIEGWGVSTDGAGGLTRPTVAGQALAIRRAWTRAGREPQRAGLIEAHGTGTAVGDPTEVRALSEVLGTEARAVPVGSIKANIGHCKAAAGIAGFIKAALATRAGVIPPHITCDEPHDVFAETGHRLVPAVADLWRGDRSAGVSGFGFGGVNAHLVLSSEPVGRPPPRPTAPRPQDAEIFLFAGTTAENLCAGLEAFAERASMLSWAEFSEAAADCARRLQPDAPFRAAVVASRPSDLGPALDAELARLRRPDAAPAGRPRIAFLFPGQAAPVRVDGGLWAKRFPELAAPLLARLPAKATAGDVATEIAQPAIAASCVLGVAVLARAGIRPDVVVGHSLGELVALHAAGSIDGEGCIDLALARGTVMARHARYGGAMVRLAVDRAAAHRHAARYGLEVACANGPIEHVLAGDTDDVDLLLANLGEGERLAVSHAFHSTHMAPAAVPWGQIIGSQRFERPTGIELISTVSGAPVAEAQDVHELLVRQLTEPVRFDEALGALLSRADILVEVGPGAGLSRLAAERGAAVLPVDAGARSLRNLLDALAALWRAGAPVAADFLFDDRALRPLRTMAPTLLRSPCGSRTDRAQVPRLAMPSPAAPVVHDTAPVPPLADDALAAAVVATATELGLPVAAVSPAAKLLDDLHLNSLAVGRIVNAASRSLGVAPPAMATDLAGATVGELADHLAELQRLGPTSATSAAERIDGVAPWVAHVEVTWQDVAWPASPAEPIRWRLFADVDMPEVPFADTRDASSSHALVVLAPVAGDPHGSGTAHAVWRLVKAARSAGARHLAIVHFGSALAGFARSLLADAAFDSAVLIDLSARPLGWQAITALLQSTEHGFAAWRLTADGTLERAALVRCPADVPAPHADLGAGNVIVVSGGAKGIGAECALRLGAATGAALVLLGRSDPAATDVAATLARAWALGLEAKYVQLDLADATAANTALREVAAQAPSPALLLHAAGVNEPAPFDALSEADLARTLAPKGDALAMLLAAFAEAPPRAVVAFGSVIGEFGLPGEAHYALANAFQSAALTAWGEASGMRALALDWSIWAGIGMGERLGAVERLQRDGVDAVPLGAALEQFEAVVLRTRAAGRRLVTARFGSPPGIVFAAGPQPPLRFVQHVRVHYPGIELVVDADLAPGADPWLEDHVLDGRSIVPAVLLMEAMAQAALAVTGARHIGVFESVAFLRAVTVGPGERSSLRIAALVRDDGRVELVVRASDDGFAADRARAILTPELPTPPVEHPECRFPPNERLEAGELYDGLWFSAGRFRRIEALEELSAFHLRAVLASTPTALWFGPYESDRLVLGDPGLRDAGLHALQACVPQRRVLPVGADEVAILDAAATRASVEAVEVESDDREFVFDLCWRDPSGRAVERWRGARFRAIGPRSVIDVPLPLAAVSLERAIAMASRCRDVRLATSQGNDRDTRRRRALAAVGCHGVGVRGDGAPTCASAAGLSLSHGRYRTLVARADRPVSCDVVDEPEGAAAALHPADADLVREFARSGWGDAPAGVLAAAVWAARECLRKVGVPARTSLRALPTDGSGLLRFAAASTDVLCCPGRDGVLAILVTHADYGDRLQANRARTHAHSLTAP